jgi:hypothetical protein
MMESRGETGHPREIRHPAGLNPIGFEVAWAGEREINSIVTVVAPLATLAFRRSEVAGGAFSS